MKNRPHKKFAKKKINEKNRKEKEKIWSKNHTKYLFFCFFRRIKIQLKARK